MAEKGQSPFYPGRPVPAELFVGRDAQIDHILKRGVGQVERGKPIAMFVQGEYGIGKSSIARYVHFLAAEQHGLLPIYVSLATAKHKEDLAAGLVEGALHSGAVHPSRGDKIRAWLAKYIGQQSLFGVSVNLAALRADAPQIASIHGILEFLREALAKARGKDAGSTQGVFVVLDEINGLANDPWFAQFLKGLVDTNIGPQAVPLLLMLCGTEERRRQLITCHEPVARIFDIVEIESMTADETRALYTQAFSSVGMTVTPEAMAILADYCDGLPKVAHLIGDWAYWLDKDLIVDLDDAVDALVKAAEDFGSKYIDQQVLAAMRSADYRSILGKIARGLAGRISKKEIAALCDPTELRKLDNFLQKMKQLNVLRAGDAPGDYVFATRLVHVYLRLKSAELAASRRALPAPDAATSD